MTVDGHEVELSDYGKRQVQHAARIMFEASKNIPDRDPDAPTTLEQRIDDMGAERAMVELLLAHTDVTAAARKILLAWDPVRIINTFGKEPDIALGPGIEVRRIDLSIHCLTVRDHDHHDRVFTNMWGHWPHYVWHGFALPWRLDLSQFRTTYGKKKMKPCAGIPRDWRNFSLEAMIAIVDPKPIAHSPKQMALFA